MGNKNEFLKHKYINVFYTLMSYVAIFLLGIYVDKTMHAETVEIYEWILTGFFAIFFFFISITDKLKKE